MSELNPNMSTAAWIRIGPDLARSYLTNRSEVQRRISNMKVRTFAKDMVEGRWHEHGQPIQFDTEGRLMDGQHRLEAIVMSGKTIKMLVVRNVPADSFAYVDIGTRRTASQFLEGPHRADITYAADWLQLFELTEGTFRNWANLKGAFTIQDTVSYVAKHPDIAAFAGHADQVYKACRLHRGTHIALLVLVAGAGYVDDIDEWTRGLAQGVGLDSGDPRLMLRERWYRDSRLLNSGNHQRGSAVTRWAYLVKAWNAFVQGRSIGVLRYSTGEPMPKPIDVM